MSIINKKLFSLLTLFFLYSGTVLAQNIITLTGTVFDVSGVPLPGATVIEVGTSNDVMTDLDGRFSIKVSSEGKIEISFIGFKTQIIAIEGRKRIDVQLLEDQITLDDVVVVAYGVQKKANLTGSVAGIDNEELTLTKNSNVQNSLAGKIAGVRVVQTNAEPGNFDSYINIRNFDSPLIIIDGVPRETLGRLNSTDIESISVVKDASAAVYGVKAADGVIIITTKKGKKEKFQLTYEGNLNLSTLSGLPYSLNAIQYMEMTNEASMRSYERPGKIYSSADFEPYINGDKLSTDWYNATVRDITPSYQHTISATGGTDKSTYYLSLAFKDQESFYKTGDLNFNQYSFRSNISTEIVKGLTLTMNLWGNLDVKAEPQESASWVVRAVWRQRPIESIYANDREGYFLKTNLDGYNPVVMTDKDYTGYKNTTNKYLQSLFVAEYKPDFIQGLSAKISFSYDTHVNDYKEYQKAYTLYTYSATKDEYTPNILHSPSFVHRSYTISDNYLFNASLNYDRTFGDHHLSGMFLFEESHNEGDNFYARRFLSIALDQLFAGLPEDQLGSMNVGGLYEYASRAYVARFNYDYKGKYLIELSGRYDMSSRFSSRHRGGFFPGGSVGYRISEENFWKENSILSKINNFKIRASYGKMGRDTSLDFQFLSGYNYPSSGYVFDGSFVPGMNSTGLANENISWETCYTWNVGFDIEAWQGLFGYTFDVFSRTRTGIFGTRSLSLPGTTGTDLPQENLNGEKTSGYDMSFSHHNHIGDFYYSITGNLSYAFTQNLYRDRASAGNSYENWKNNNSYRNIGVWRGYGAAGRYENWDQILESDIMVGYGTLPGDFIYEDWNGDGYISDLDVHTIGYSGLPQIYYGLTFNMSWKGIDLNMLFQGTDRRWVQYSEILRTPLWGGGNSPSYFYDRWHPINPDADPYDPATEWNSGKYAYGNQIARDNSEFVVENAAYLRLKSIELGYTLPVKWTKRVGISSFRVYGNSYNALTFSQLKYVNPEHLSSNNGYLYPINRTFNFGVQIIF